MRSDGGELGQARSGPGALRRRGDGESGRLTASGKILPIPCVRTAPLRFRRPAGGLRRVKGLAGLLTVLLALASPASAQSDLEGPLLPEEISTRDIELRGRYARQWKQDDGTWVVMYTGGFELVMGQRRLSANAAVTWITPHHAEDGRKYHELTVYLSENAQVQEYAGTIIEDRYLLVSNLRTFGRIVKYHDAHAPEVGEQSPLYQQALRDRREIETWVPPPVEVARPPVEVPAPPGEVPAPPGEAPRPPTAVARPPVGVTRPPAERVPVERKPRALRYELPEVEPARTAAGELVYVARRSAARRIYLGRDGGPDAPMLEIQADHAVVFPGEGLTRDLVGRGIAGVEMEEPASEPAAAPPPSDLPPPAQPAPTPRPAPPVEPPPAQTFVPRGLARAIRGVYLEGDVVLSLGTSFIRANRLYYDFEHERALILDAVFRADLPERQIPLYVRADEIRQLSAREFSADNARITTSEFHSPHYHIGAEKIVIRDLTPRDAAGRAVDNVVGEYQIRHATANVEGFPLWWWPYARGRFDASETGLRRFRTGYSSRYGAELETGWNLFHLVGVAPPEGYDATWRLDYFSQRGPATGIDLDYQRDDYFGLFRSYYIYDDGRDHLGPLRRHEEEPDSHNRGRVLWRHRHYLPDNWELTFELSYISDPNFLEEYRKSEFHEGKEQETLVYLKRAGEVDALTFLANWRLLDFVTQTEHLPELTYRRIGDTFLSPLVMYHESRIGNVRYRVDDRHFLERRRFSNAGESDLTFRPDARQEIELPLKLGPLNLVPFATLRGSYWDGSPLHDGGLWRGMGIYGVRGSTVFSRVFDEIKSELFDVNRIRHVIRPDFAAWWAHSNTRSELITPFDYGIETIDAFYGTTAGLRQTWQTQRGGADNWRTVDLFTLNLEVGLFGDTDGRQEQSGGWAWPLRPENSRTRNYFAGDAIWRLSDTTSLLYDFNLDLNDGRLDRHNVSLAVERLPRLAYVFGYRYAGDLDMSLVGGGWNYKLTEKHITTVRAWLDMDRGDLGEVSLAYVRRLPRWYAALSFDYDRVEDDFRVSLSIWPEGIPEWAIGSRRFTGLGTTTGIRP